jgi:hypothetical protein
LLTEDALGLVERIGVAFVVVVNIELAAPNDCAMPEPGVRLGSAGEGRAPPSASAILRESRPVIAPDYYKVVSSAKTKIESEVSEMMLCKNLRKGKWRKWVLCRLVGCNAESRNIDMKPARKFNTQGRIGKQVGGVGLVIVMQMGEERGV